MARRRAAAHISSVDVWLKYVDAGCVITSLTRPEVAAVATTYDEAMSRFEALATALLKDDPLAFDDTERREGAARVLTLSLPAQSGGRLAEMTMHCLLIDYPVEGGHHLYVPQIGLRFFSETGVRGRELITEQIRDAVPLQERLHQLRAMTRPLHLMSEEDQMPADGGIGVAWERIAIRFRPETGADEDEDDVQTPTLHAVADPLHKRLAKKDASRAFERRVETDLVQGYLADRFDRSVLLVGPPGGGKTAIVHEVVGRIVRGEAGEALENAPVWEISGGRLMAGMRYLGQWQERLIALISEVRESGAILFAPDLVELLQTSGTEQHTQGVAGLLLPYIASGEVVLVTEVRPEQLAWATQRHPGFVRALRRVSVEPMDTARTDVVLERLSYRLGRQHGVRLSVETRQKILELTQRFGSTLALPGPAVMLAERMARVWSDEGTGRREEGEVKPLLTPEDAVTSYASQTGMPAALLDPDLSFDLEEVRRFFSHRIFDQPEAVDAMVALVAVIRAGLNSPHRPLGSFLFLGPTGVGKTQTALTLAHYLFGAKDRVLRFDMSEYQDAWAAGRLVGRYRGERGELVARIREQPFQVILIDEIEKAHASVFDLLLQAIGEGRLTDGLGATVDLTSTVFVMTSNLGAGGPPSLGFETQDAAERRERAASHYQRAVEGFFRPEFVGRIDRVIPFRSLGKKTAQRLVERALEEAFAREGITRRGIRARVSEGVIAFLIEHGFDERYGARPLRQIVEARITATLANFIARESDVRDVEIVFDMVNGAPVLMPL